MKRLVSIVLSLAVSTSLLAAPVQATSASASAQFPADTFAKSYSAATLPTSAKSMGALPQSIGTFADAPTRIPSDWALKEVTSALLAGIVPLITGNPRYQDNITREQFAEIAHQTIVAICGSAPDASATPAFTDCTNPSVLSVAAAGIVAGVGDGKFDPTALSDREQIATMVSRTIAYINTRINTKITLKPADLSKFTDKPQVSAWALDGVGTLAANGIMSGTSATTLSPKATCTVEQSVLFLYRVYNLATGKSDTPAEQKPVFYKEYPGLPNYGALYGLEGSFLVDNKGERTLEYYEYTDPNLLANQSAYITALANANWRWVLDEPANFALRFRNPSYPKLSMRLQYPNTKTIRVILVPENDTTPISPLRNYPDGPGNVPDFAAALGWDIQNRSVDNATGATTYTYTGDMSAMDSRYLAWYDQLLNAGFVFIGTKGENKTSVWLSADSEWCVEESLVDTSHIVSYVVSIVPHNK